MEMRKKDFVTVTDFMMRLKMDKRVIFANMKLTIELKG